jgi:hypothetical protein
VASNAKLAIKQAGQDISKKIHSFYPSIFNGKKAGLVLAKSQAYSESQFVARQL